IVAFGTGGLPDMVRPGVTGFLAPSRDPDQLAHGIARLAADPELWRRISSTCRQTARAEYAIEVQASNYHRIYRELAARTPAQAGPTPPPLPRSPGPGPPRPPPRQPSPRPLRASRPSDLCASGCSPRATPG